MKKLYTYIDFLIEKEKRERKYFENYQKYTRIIKKETEKIVGQTKVYIFGSILRKREVPRDIDILIISPEFENLQIKNKVLTRIWKKIGFLSPFEIHLITSDQYQNWYRFFIKEKIEIKE